MMKDFSAWLSDMLVERGMSQKTLAQLTGVTGAAVTGWVNGRSEPRYEKIAAIAAALGVEVEDAVSRRTPVAPSGDVKWIFRVAPEDGGREGGNTATFAFSPSLEVLAREATQNSLDEQLPGSEPVVARHTLHELTGHHLRDFMDALGWESIEEHINAAADVRQKVGRVLRDGLQELERTQRLILLRVDDFNATGLTGPEFDDGRFARVVRRTLDSGKAGAQGGSFGLGKAALWAASRFGLVLVNSTLSEPEGGRTERRMAGRLELPWHTLDGVEYAGPGWFGTAAPGRQNTAQSWWGEKRAAESLYLERNDSAPGTSFLVVGAYDGSGETEDLEDMHDRLVKSLARNFWASMVGGMQEGAKLRASVAAFRNGEPVKTEEVIDPHVHEPARSRAVQAFLDGDTVEELTDRNQVLQTTVPLELRRRKDDMTSEDPGVHEAVLLLTPSGEDEQPDCIAYMRATRMVVKYKRVGDLPLGHRPFQAVLLAGAATRSLAPDAVAAEQFLRTAEPPDHNDWLGTEDLTATYERGARQKIMDFKKTAEQKVREVLRGQQDEASQDEGPEVLRDLLRLDPPKVTRSQGFPIVKAIEGAIDDTGAWDVTVTVKLPKRDEPWVLAAVPRFLTRSAGPLSVGWSKLFPLDGCALTPHGNLAFRDGATQGKFRGITDASSHPVSAAMSQVMVDVRRAKEELS
ncbi:helix-turn-helix transcriptional regulator [Streptomyces phaeochromogenes]|uniref:helix-turn-helix transcriptional regulator n=1 Tax=Streptomyces phaeochromogenes TaxID=1923 RepID=UPI0006E3F90E|nr:helix-turn-helix transcriptional regulator [Streptomyces phaeochromogenes]